MNSANSILLAAAVGAAALTVSAADDPAEDLRREGAETQAASRDSWLRLGTLERASKLIGSPVLDPAGGKLGRVKDLAVDIEGGRVLEIIVGTGGVLGVGEKLTGVPPELVSMHDKGGVTLNTDREKLLSAPGIDLDKWSEATEKASIESRQRHFGNGAARQLQSSVHYRSLADKTGPEVARRVERGSKLLGLPVTSTTGDKVGKVEDLVVDLAAAWVTEVVVSTGGFLGIGDELSAVPPSLFRFGVDHGTLVLQASKELVHSAPRFKPEEWPQHASPERVGEVYRAYGVKPYFDAGKAADNSQRNVRDRNQPTLTPLDQGNNEPDLKITTEIRQRVIREEGLTTMAKNIKIITVSGRVTLRGPVQTAREKERIEAIAHQVAGVGRVDSELEVASGAK